jgi:hypothetical protein
VRFRRRVAFSILCACFTVSPRVHEAAAGPPFGAVPAWTVVCSQAGANFGYSIASGDVNRDGFADVVVGARFYDEGETDEGKAFLYLGGPSGLSSTPAWTAQSDQAGARFGVSVASGGDVNGDGFNDVLVGATLASGDQANSGRAFLYLGSAGGLSSTPSWIGESHQGFSNYGVSVAFTGDVNGDGFNDVLIGADTYDNPLVNEGAVFLYLGSATGLPLTPSAIRSSGQAYSDFGLSVAGAGDVNGDGYDDVLVGADLYTVGSVQSGRAFLYLGSPSGIGAQSAWVGQSTQDGALYGCSVASAGDINRDGFDDVLVGAQHDYVAGQSLGYGRAYLYRGARDGLGQQAAWTEEGDSPGAHVGHAVASAGDVNGDGFPDVIVGAHEYSHPEILEGRVSLYLGGVAGLSDVVWSVESDTSGVGLGSSVAAGDVNGDHLSDVVIGASGDDNGVNVAGYAETYLATGPPPTAIERARAGARREMLVLCGPSSATSGVSVRVRLSYACGLRADMHDIRGRRIARVLDETRDAGWHTLVWNARDAAARSVPSGLYVLRVEACGVVRTTRVLVAR